MKQLVIIASVFVIVLSMGYMGYNLYMIDKRMETLEEMIEQTAQETKKRPQPQIIGQPTPSRWPWEPSTDPRRIERRLQELERQEHNRRLNEMYR